MTTRDAGGPLEIVTDRQTGVVCEPDPAAIAKAVTWLGAHPDEARAWARSGKELAALLSWDTVVDRLLGS